jgi:hypothetical protein
MGFLLQWIITRTDGRLPLYASLALSALRALPAGHREVAASALSLQQPGAWRRSLRDGRLLRHSRTPRHFCRLPPIFTAAFFLARGREQIWNPAVARGTLQLPGGAGAARRAGEMPAVVGGGRRKRHPPQAGRLLRHGLERRGRRAWHRFERGRFGLNLGSSHDTCSFNLSLVRQHKV